MKKGLSPTAWSTLPFLAAGDFSVSHPCLGVNASLLPLKTKANHQKSSIESWEAQFKFVFLGDGRVAAL